jgi:hypothetical protein
MPGKEFNELKIWDTAQSAHDYREGINPCNAALTAATRITTRSKSSSS